MTQEQMYEKARRIVAARRQKATVDARLQLEKAQMKLPTLTQIQQERSLAGLQIARLATLGASQEEQAQAFTRAKELDTQYLTLLQSVGLNEELLNPQYTCALCKDSGTYQGTACSCVRNLVSEMRQEEISQTSPLALCSFESFDVEKYPNTVIPEYRVTAREQMEQILAYCKAYAQHFSMSNSSLYLCGYAGLGKTHLALSIANFVLQHGVNVVYISAQDAFDRMEKERFDSEGETLRTLENAQLLILDDLGTEFLSPYISACLYSLINTRCNRHRPTIYTSNIVNDADLRRRYTEKIVSRLLGSCEVLTFCGDDIRLQGK